MKNHGYDTVLISQEKLTEKCNRYRSNLFLKVFILFYVFVGYFENTTNIKLNNSYQSHCVRDSFPLTVKLISVLLTLGAKGPGLESAIILRILIRSKP